MNIKSKMTFFFGGLSISVFLILNIFLSIKLKDILLEKSINELKNTATLIQKKITLATSSSIKSYLQAIAEKGKELADYYFQEAKAGKITEKNAYESFRKIILSPTFSKIGHTGYLAGVSTQGILKIHPKAEGMDVTKFDFIKKAIAMKNGYLEYNWKNPGEESERTKAGYIIFFEPWDLLIWASSYKDEFSSLVNMDDIEKEILPIKIGKTGYIFIMDNSGKLIVHPTSKGKNIADKAHIKKIIAQKKGQLVYSQTTAGTKKGAEKIVYFDYIPDLKLIVVVGTYLDEFYQPINRVNHIIIFISLIAIALFLLFSLKISSFFTKSLLVLREKFSLASKGDLNQHYPLPSLNCSNEIKCGKNNCPVFNTDSNQLICYLEVGSYAPGFGKPIHCPSILSGKFKDCKECRVFKMIAKDEILTLAAEFNQFVLTLKEKILSLKRKLEIINQSTENLASNSIQTAASIQELSSSNHSVVTNTNTQKSMIIDSTESINQIINGISNIFEYAQKNASQISEASSAIEEMAASIKSTSQLADKGDHTAKNLSNTLAEADKSMNTLSDAIKTVSTNSEKIVEMVQLIMDISEQTNLLAMNAAIEAAHAGEYGKGFAVVAEEIRKLADRSSSGAKQIQGVVKEISANLSSNLDLVAQTEKNFAVLEKSVINVTHISNETAIAMEEQQSANQSILNVISDLQQIGEKTKNRTQEETVRGKQIEQILNKLNTISFEITSAMEEEQSALDESSSATENISLIANNLKEIAREIESEFNFFKV